MKNLEEYIKEALTAKDENKANMVLTLLKGTKLTKDNVKDMMKNLEMKDLKSLDEIFSKNDNSNYIAYQPNSDEFLKDANKESVIGKMSDYALKYLCN